MKTLFVTAGYYPEQNTIDVNTHFLSEKTKANERNLFRKYDQTIYAF